MAARTVRDPASPPEQERAAGWTAQVAYRALEHRPDWDGTVLAAVSPALHEVMTRNVVAPPE